MRNKKAPAMLLAVLLSIAIFPAGAFAAPAGEIQAPAPPEPASTVKIYHTNDVQGNADVTPESVGYARLATYIKQDEADGKLLFDAGDAFHGNTFATLSKGQSIAEIMKSLDYNAFVPGNHDLSYGLPTLEKLAEASGADALSVNIMQDGLPVFDSYHIYKTGGVAIGVLGISSPTAMDGADADNLKGVDILNGELLYQKTQQAVNEMRQEGVNAVIALTHLGTGQNSDPSSVDIATHVTGIDLVIDGYSHALYPNGYTDYPGYIAGQTPMILQAGSALEAFGVVEMNFDENGNIMGILPFTVDAESVANVTADKKIGSVISTYAQEQQTFLQRPVSYTPVFLNGESEFVYTGPTNFTTMVGDAMLLETGADIALFAGRAVRTSIPSGDITAAELNNALPSGSYVVTTTVSGAELKGILNAHMVLGLEDFVQFSGIHVVAEKYLAADGSYAGRVKSITRDGVEISDDDQFTVATTDDLYNGDLGYRFTSPLIREYHTLYETVGNYFKNSSEEMFEDTAQGAQFVLLEQILDADDVLSKLLVAVPVDIHVALTRPAMVPENILYALIGQDRNLVFTVDGAYPYGFIFDGSTLNSPSNVSLEADVSQKTPPNKKRASTADKDAFFVDLSDNQTIPSSVYMQVYVGSAYEPGSTVYIYYYDVNNDILPYDEEGVTVMADGSIVFPAQAGATYLINSKLLNAATSYELPSPEQPYSLGIFVIFAVFIAWVIFFLITKKGSQAKK